MKTLKTLLSLMLVAALSLTLFACGKKEETKTIGAAAAKDLYKQLCQELEFDDKDMSEVDQMVVGAHFDLPEGAEILYFRSPTGLSADQVAMFTAKDQAQVKEIEEIIKDKIASLGETYADYQPQELTKITHAVYKSNGNYVFFVICKNDEAAEEIIDKAFEKATEQTNEK